MNLARYLFLVLLVAIFVARPIVASATLIGTPAPDFSVESTQGSLTLSEYQGKKNVVLAFYFADFTPV